MLPKHFGPPLLFVPRPFLLILTAALLLPAPLESLFAEEKSATGEQTGFPLNPQELLAAVAKNTRPQWRACFPDLAHDSAGDRRRTALVLGALVADCYLAAEARDAQQLRNQLMDMAAVEKSLSISKAMESGRQRLADLAVAGDWAALRDAIGDMVSLHSKTLKAQMDEPLAEIETLGLWLRTLQISAVHTSKMAKTPDVPCIWSDAFLGSLEKRAAAAAKRDKDPTSLNALAAGMGSLKDLWTDETTPARAAERLAATLTLLDKLTKELIYSTIAAPP